MIDRFNFYDVYGYLLPGLALVALLGLPGVTIAGKLPSSELVSALAAVAAAYVIGQLAHAFARAFFERERPFAAKLAELSVPAKARLERRLAEACGRPIAITDKSVFDICRRVLQDQKRGQVADQFQGMYALTRGLCLAFLAAAAYYAGISLWGLYRQHAVQWAWLVPFFFGCLWLTVARANPRPEPKGTAEGSPMRASAGEAGQHTDEPSERAPDKTDGGNADQAQSRAKPTQESRKRREQQRCEATAAVLSLVVMGAAVAIFMPVRPNRFEAFGAAVPFLLLFALKMYRVSREQDSNVAKTVLNDFLVEPPAKRPEGENDNKSS